MKKVIISLYIILMILALNCYSPFQTYNDNFWNNLSFNDKHSEIQGESRIYAMKRVFDETHLAYTRGNRNPEKEQPLTKKIKNILKITKDVNKHIGMLVKHNQKFTSRHLNSENKKLALLKLGVNKEKIIVADDAENGASFF